tara:strand:+ start:1020 stop:1766 length:747 start_codon:yes stop_codon:yes gene_type:complete
MKKEGQATIFFIIGIIILAVISIVVYFYESSFLIQEEIIQDINLPFELQELKTNVQSCVNDISSNAIYILGLQGGHINLNQNTLKTEQGEISYGYFNEEIKLPKINEMEKEFNEYVNEILPICADLENYDKFNLDFNKPITNVNVLGENVNVRVNYNIIASKGDVNYRLNDPYISDIPVRFSKIYALVDGIVRRVVQDTESIDIDYLLNSEFKVSVITIDENNVVYIIGDEESKVDDVEYVFMFATGI